jgi:hypothetical protein
LDDWRPDADFALGTTDSARSHGGMMEEKFRSQARNCGDRALSLDVLAGQFFGFGRLAQGSEALFKIGCDELDVWRLNQTGMRPRHADHFHV